MARVYVSVGSNVDRETNVRSAIQAMRREFGPLTISTIYETEPVGFKGDVFYNLVVGFDSVLLPKDIFSLLRSIEADHGRERGKNRYAPRTLDLDLLMYDDLVLNQTGLHLPSDEILRYAFVLSPLAEIAPDRLHPRQRKSMYELWQEFDDESQKLIPVSLNFN